MRRILPVVLALGLTSIARAESPEIELFDGKSLDGWTVEGPSASKVGDKEVPVWSARDGTLVTTNRVFGFLRYSKREFADFAFSFEYRIAPKSDSETGSGNSGVGVRTCPYDPKKSAATRPSYFAYEVQIIDDAGKPPTVNSTASLYRYVAPTKNVSRPAGEWNAMTVTCVGPKIAVALNGETVIDVDQTNTEKIQSKPLKGYLCLQSHGPNRAVEFRKLRVRELAPPAAKDTP